MPPIICLLSLKSPPVSLLPTPISLLDRYLAFRRTLPPRPPLARLTVRARGVDFAVWRSPDVDDGPPLLCINGGLLFDHSLLWPALAPLARRRSLVLYDQRGRGKSGTPPGIQASRFEFDAGDVRALREAIGIPQWDVLGHSWGGGIAMLAAADDRVGIRKLVLVNAVGVTSEWLPPLHSAALARLRDAARERLAALDVAALIEPDLAIHAAYARAFFPAWFADRDFAAAVTAPLGMSVTGAVVASKLRRNGYDWRATLRDVVTPTLVVHGAADLLPVHEAERTAETLRAARLRVIADAGHNPFWEAPVAFFAAVEAFLEEPPPDS